MILNEEIDIDTRNAYLTAIQVLFDGTWLE